jgi:hypothetical protein
MTKIEIILEKLKTLLTMEEQMIVARLSETIGVPPILELSDQLVGLNDRINKLQDEVKLLKNQVRQP